jgi:putative aldouronate transport system permease protein
MKKVSSINNYKGIVSKERRRKLFFNKIFLNRQIYLMLIPVLLFYILFSYLPMYGITLAWKDYRPKYGIMGSDWVGWKNFEYIFSMPELKNAIGNTLKISFLKLLICFPMPIFFAILLNEVNRKGYKKTIQTMIYLPNFISWVILGGIVKMLLAYDAGAINNLLEKITGERCYFLLEPDKFYGILIITEIWKSTGWGTIIYTASIAGIDSTLYEAAELDGCKRFGLIWHITLPMIMPIITVMLIMALSNIMNAGFDPVYNLYNPTIYETADIIDTYAYRLFMEMRGKEEASAAVGIFKTVINFILLIVGNYITKKINGYNMFAID